MNWQITYHTEIAKMSEADKKELKRALFCEELHESLKELGEPNAEAQAMRLALKCFELEEAIGQPLHKRMLQATSSALEEILKPGSSVDALLSMPLAEFKQHILDEVFCQAKRASLAQEAAKQLFLYFGLREDDEEDDYERQAFEDLIGVSYAEAIDPEHWGYCLGILVELYEHAEDGNEPANATWKKVIDEFIDDGAMRHG